jgi:hypothetical protein
MTLFSKQAQPNRVFFSFIRPKPLGQALVACACLWRSPRSSSDCMNPSVGDGKQMMPLSLRGLSFISNRRRYRQDIFKHIKRSMYPHVQTSPHGPRLQNHRPLLVFAPIACHPSVNSANCCCGADLGHLGLLRHIPHTARAKDVSAELTGCNWSSGHDLDMDIHALMRQFLTMLGRILILTAGIDQSAHHISISLGEHGNIAMQSGGKIHVLIRLSERLADGSTLEYHRFKDP